MLFFHTTKVQQFSDMTKLFLLKISKNTKKKERATIRPLYLPHKICVRILPETKKYYNYINRIKALLVYSYLYF
jgi:ribosomal protein L30/L7E